MKIERPLQQENTDSLTRHNDHNPSSSRHEDANFFASLLEPSTRPITPAPASSGVAAAALNYLDKSSDEMKKSLKAFNSELSEKNRLSYSSHLSNTMLMTQMLVKSVGKGAQLVEKISNLQ
ncbi:hypothetical protein PSH66_03775 [Pseudomonas sp. FP597]|uniref:hypothetical protein n=1 Tax=Pseudomonas sp. FP597 TaxID=2954096 RepID=UPI0027364E17|nr:hypothetical protein [Pseudomonas sp. FP597]WLI07466.1 hypothetical protein PSH66_03775 [Pseudomonas sp. FP597]